MKKEQNIQEPHEQALNIPVVSGMLLDDEIQNECWFQIVNTVEDISNEPTWDEVIKILKLNYMVVPRNYR